MEKLEWREAFQRQPAYYLFLDLTSPMTIANVNSISQTLLDMTVLAVSLKGSSRFSVLGVYILSARAKCIFPLQSIKHNYTKFQFSLECMQSTHTLFTGMETFDTDELSISLQNAVQQYETYYQGAVLNKEEWPQLQIVFFSAQTFQKFSKLVRVASASIELAYIRKINLVMLRPRVIASVSNSSGQKSDPEQCSSQSIFESDDAESIIDSLLDVTEIEGNAYQLENVMKSWLHDCGSDSDHLRLLMDNKLVLRCDIRECLLNTDSLPVAGQFCLFPDSTPAQHVGRANPISKQAICASKVPIYTLEAISVIQKEGLCESLLFGYPVVATATRCWKMDWEELERNQQQFIAITNYLHERNFVLLAKRHASLITSTEKTTSAGFFVLFPSRNALLVKSVASRELLLPPGEFEDKSVPEEMKMEVKECMDNLEQKDLYNPMSVSSGLYSYLSSTLAKCKSRPSTNFIVPIINKDEDKVGIKRKKKCAVAPVAEVSTKKPVGSVFGIDFMSASALFKKKFPQHID